MGPRRIGYLFIVAAIAIVLAGASAARANVMPAGSQASAGNGRWWPTAGHDIGNTRDASDEHVIGPRNVSQLTTAWSITAAGGVGTTPPGADGTVYFSRQGGKLWAADARTGRVLWSRDVTSYFGYPAASRVSPAVFGDELIFGASNASEKGMSVVAVNRYTGALLWSTEVDTHIAAWATSSPVVYRGVAYMGVSSYEEGLALEPGYQCCTFPRQRRRTERHDWAAAVEDLHRPRRLQWRRGLGQHSGDRPRGEHAVRGHRRQLLAAARRLHQPHADGMHATRDRRPLRLRAGPGPHDWRDPLVHAHADQRRVHRGLRRTAKSHLRSRLRLRQRTEPDPPPLRPGTGGGRPEERRVLGARSPYRGGRLAHTGRPRQRTRRHPLGLGHRRQIRLRRGQRRLGHALPDHLGRRAHVHDRRRLLGGAGRGDRQDPLAGRPSQGGGGHGLRDDSQRGGL